MQNSYPTWKNIDLNRDLKIKRILAVCNKYQKNPPEKCSFSKIINMWSGSR